MIVGPGCSLLRTSDGVSLISHLTKIRDGEIFGKWELLTLTEICMPATTSHENRTFQVRSTFSPPPSRSPQSTPSSPQANEPSTMRSPVTTFLLLGLCLLALLHLATAADAKAEIRENIDLEYQPNSPLQPIGFLLEANCGAVSARRSLIARSIRWACFTMAGRRALMSASPIVRISRLSCTTSAVPSMTSPPSNPS
jgi:hypothetical protein